SQTIRFKDFAINCEGKELAMLGAMLLPYEPDDIFHRCYVSLAGAGVITKDSYKTSPAVLEWVGEENIEWMRESFGENWSCVAELEYCVNHFPRSSLASLAAEFMFSHFVVGDDYSCGYLAKQIEAIFGGVEEVAASTLETRKKAGAGGGRFSSERRRENLEVLMQEIEGLASVVEHMSEDAIFEQAFVNAKRRHRSMPATKKSREAYGTALRSEEPFRSRYFSVFRKNV
ncbi:MAG: hypothetical protein P8Q23_05475, partial [Paracoccaceae bacterium]|nr:hypothetical protein [Paracoccaceae bacterium]